MAMTLEQLTKGALALSGESRAMLADKLVESLDSGELTQIDQLWVAEAKRRRDEVRSGRVRTVPGPEALKRVRRAVSR